MRGVENMTINSIARSQMQDTMTKLSTMQRINSAADDAAGLAIAQKIQAQVTGLEQGNRNTLDMKSLIQTAEGALSTIDDSLQRVRELSVQASNGIYTDSDRALIQQEIGQQLDQISRVSRDTEFNKMKLLDGSFTNRHTASDAAGRGATISLPDMGTLALGLQGYDVTRSGQGAANARTEALQASLTAARQDLAGRQANLQGPAQEAFAGAVQQYTGAQVQYEQQSREYTQARDQLTETLSNAGIANVGALTDGSITPGSAQYAGPEQAAALVSAVQRYTQAAGTLGLDELGMGNSIQNLDAGQWGINPNALDNTVQSRSETPAAGTGMADFRQAQTDFAGAQVTYQTAVNERDAAQSRVSVVEGMLREAGSGASSASSGLDRIDNALSQVSSARAYLGAMSNRMDYTYNSNSITMLNQAAAKSRIVDLDVARASSDLSRGQIVQQYQIAAQKREQEQQSNLLSVLM